MALEMEQAADPQPIRVDNRRPLVGDFEQNSRVAMDNGGVSCRGLLRLPDLPTGDDIRL